VSAPLYLLEHVKQRYSGRLVLDVERLELPEGAIVGLAGHNGSGKSTLLRILAFLEPPIQGRVLYRGKENGVRNPLLRREVTLLTQEPYLLKRTVRNNVAYGLRLRGQGRDEARIDNALRMVGLDPEEFGRRDWHELSGGEAQRVALASRLVLDPRVLLLDEPTASLDEESAEMVKRAAFLARERFGSTVVIVSHDRDWLEAACDSILRIRKGRLEG
jgi:tungstate transport system ATP-binding protein